MARTQAGAELTARHRQGQLAIRARALQDFIRLWPLWTGDEASFQQLLLATLPLVRAYHALSSTLGSSYFEAFRRAEGVAGASPPHLPPVPDDASILGPLHVTGADMTTRAIASGATPEAAMRTALVRTSGTVTRQVLAGGRDTIVLSTAADREAVGWTRVTSDTPCAFCALLASRGPVYTGETADFKAHDHCSCAGEPYYAGSEWPGRGKEFRALYNRVAAGSENPVNELRRALNAQQA